MSSGSVPASTPGDRRRRSAQGVRRDPGPRGRGSRRRARHRARRRRRERCRQVHPDEDPRRRGPPGPRRGPRRRRAGPAGVRRPMPARSAIGIVYQELSLFPERSILANLFPDRPTDQVRSRGPGRDAPARGAGRWRAWDSTVDPDTPSATLASPSASSSSCSRVLIERPRVLILDEPNSALNERETRPAVRRPARAVRRRHHDHLRVAPPRGGVRDRRPDHRDAQRRAS